MKIIQRMGVSLVFLVMSVPAMAGDITVSHSGGVGGGVYAGAKFGNASYDVAGESDAGYDIFAGYSINEVLSVEAGIADMGESSKAGVTNAIRLLHVGVVGKVGLNSELTGFGKAGLASWDTDYKDGSQSLSDSGTDVFFGLGIDYSVGIRSAVRFAADFYSADAEYSGTSMSEDVTLFSVGVVYNF